MQPKYEYGQQLRLIRSVRDDGTYPGCKRGDLLVQRGEIGHVVDVGTFLQDQLIYTVHFIERNIKVGCREQELITLDAPWIDSRFEFLEWVALLRPISVRGECVAREGARGQVLKVLREADGEVHYHVRVSGRTLLLRESLLQAAESPS